MQSNASSSLHDIMVSRIYDGNSISVIVVARKNDFATNIISSAKHLMLHCDNDLSTNYHKYKSKSFHLR